MPQSLLIDLDKVREKDELHTLPIAVNHYAGTVAEERKRYGNERLLTVLRSMILIREIESMLYSIKRGDEYRGITYAYGGPAHLSIGQEAAAAGQALVLTRDDHTFGSHRSHGEIVARGMVAIDQAAEAELEELMDSYLGGRTRAVVDEHLPDLGVKPRATAFFLYGLVAEIFGRSTGFNQGLGGSMHAFFTPFGVYPNNAIVGGAAAITAGAGLYKRVQRSPGLAIANIGDGSTGCGVVWEAMNFAAQEQFRSLWDEAHRGGLPVVFFFVNNFYAMGGQPIGETMGYERLARIGAAINPANMHAESIDGTNPLAVADAVDRARAWIDAGEGPILIDCQCYRYSGHSPSDASSYRTREEIEAWRALDPVPRFQEVLIDAGVISEAGAAGIEGWASELVERVVRLAIDMEISPRLGIPQIEALTFSGHEDDANDAPPGETLIPLESSPRFEQLAARPRGGKTRTESGAVQLRDALWEAIAERAVADNRLVIYGEENRDWGGAFGVYRGLTELLPYHRLFNTPLSEAAIVATAVGYAMEGGRALVELMYADFIGRAGDEVFNQLAKWTAMSGGTLRLPVVLRVSIGSSYGAQHSQDWTGLVTHIPGLKVVYPATPHDAKGLMTSALAQDDPVVFFESQKLYSVVEYLRADGVPPGHYATPFGEPRVVREGTGLTILTVGPTLYPALDAAAQLSELFGLEAEVIDVRTLVPFGLEPVAASVAKTGRILLASDATQRGSYLNTLAAEIQTVCFDDLDAPVVVLGSPNCVTPPAEFEHEYFPSSQRIVEIVHRLIKPLSGYDEVVRDLVEL